MRNLWFVKRSPARVRGPLYAKDGDQGGKASDGDGKTGGSKSGGDTRAKGEDAGDKGTGDKGGDAGGDQGKDAKDSITLTTTELQARIDAEVNRILPERITSEVERILPDRLERAKLAAEKKADEKAKETQGEFEQLAKDRATERDTAITERDAARTEVQTITTERDALRKKLLNFYQVTLTAWPKEVQDAAPSLSDKTLDVFEDWIPKGNSLATKFADAKKNGKARGAGLDPRGEGGPGGEGGAGDEEAFKEGAESQRRRTMRKI